MSRTTRKIQHFRWGNNTKEEVIADATYYWAKRPWKSVRRRKTEYQYITEYNEAVEEFNIECRRRQKDQSMEGIMYRMTLASKGHANFSIGYVNPHYYERVEVTKEEAVTEALAKFDKRTRDGYSYESTRNAGYRSDSSRSVRRKNKKLCHEIVGGAEYDTKAYPSRIDEKCRIWDWW